MFDTVTELADWEIADLVPSDPAVELVTVWDVLAARVDPGPDAIRALVSVDPRTLDAGTRAEVVSAWEAQDSWVEAQKLSALHAMDAPEPVANPDDPRDRGFAEVPERVRAEEVRLALGCSAAWAGQRVELARELCERLPVTKGLLEAGRISAYLAGIAVSESARLTDTECAVFEARVFPRGESQTPARFRKSARLVAAVLHPEHLEEAHAWAKKATDVTTWPEPYGMASLRIHAPAARISELWDTVNTEAWAQARAAKKRGEQRVPIGERRVAVFTRWARTSGVDLPNHLQAVGIDPDEPDPDDVAALVAALVEDDVDLETASEPVSPERLEHFERAAAAAAAATAEVPDAGGPASLNPLGLPARPPPKTQVGVIIDLAVLLGARDGPAALEGYGTIPGSMARQLAADGSWRRVLLEPVDGWLLDYGRTRYEPSAKLRDHLLGLGQDCRGPYCNARPRQTDHGIDWAEGGPTTARNCNGLCIHTHFLKTAHNFTVTNNADQSVTWTTPAGNSYTKPPDDLRITDHGKKPEDGSTSR